MTGGIPPLTRRRAGCWLTLSWMYAPDSAPPVGFIEQQRWSRVTDTTVLSTSEKNVPVKNRKLPLAAGFWSVWPNGWGDTETGNRFRPGSGDLALPAL